LSSRHRLAGKRQFTQDHFGYRPTPSPPHWLVALRINPGISENKFTTQHLYGRLKSFLPGTDQLGFLSFLFAKGQRRLSLSFEGFQVRASYLR
jgi:hypothetical protein